MTTLKVLMSVTITFRKSTSIFYTDQRICKLLSMTMSHQIGHIISDVKII